MVRLVAAGPRRRRPAASRLARGTSAEWVARVNRRLPDGQLEEIRGCVQRGRPLGPEASVLETAARLGLEFTLRGPGRPRTTSINQRCPLGCFRRSIEGKP